MNRYYKIQAFGTSTHDDNLDNYNEGPGYYHTENKKNRKKIKVICPYCHKKAQLVDSKEIYGKSYGPIYLCKCLPDLAYVGCHQGTETPLGRLANKELREYKKKAHYYFDQIWRNGNKKRQQAYQLFLIKLTMKTENKNGKL